MKHHEVSSFMVGGQSFCLIERNNLRFAIESGAVEQEVTLFDPYSGGVVLLDEGDQEIRVMSGRFDGGDDVTLSVQAPPGQHEEFFERFMREQNAIGDEEDEAPFYITSNVSLAELLGATVGPG